MTSQDPRSSPQAVITSDASGNWGCGAFSSMVPVAMAEFVECSEYHSQGARTNCPSSCYMGKTVAREVSSLCVCDNAAVVAIVNSGSSKDSLVMHLMRCLFVTIHDKTNYIALGLDLR